MQFDRPSWRLKNQRCQCSCGGEGYLVLSACPKCRFLMLECDEVGTVFPNPKDIGKEIDWTPNPSGEVLGFTCPSCGTHGLTKLDLATAEEIQAFGFQNTDYE